MFNLAGNKDCDEFIIDELKIADIFYSRIERGNTEVPYSYVGRISKWVFTRSWIYWRVHIEETELGLSLDIAMGLHNTRHSIKK